MTGHVEGEIVLRTFSDEETGVASVRTVNVAGTATAHGNIFRLRDVGADVVRIEPDETAVEFAGALMIDLETGETILEPRDRSDEQVARACRALTRG